MIAEKVAELETKTDVRLDLQREQVRAAKNRVVDAKRMYPCKFRSERGEVLTSKAGARAGAG